jgi:hypothetical protein
MKSRLPSNQASRINKHVQNYLLPHHSSSPFLHRISVDASPRILIGSKKRVTHQPSPWESQGMCCEGFRLRWSSTFQHRTPWHPAAVRTHADAKPVCRQELVAWLNNLLQLNITKVEQCGTGYVTWADWQRAHANRDTVQRCVRSSTASSVSTPRRRFPTAFHSVH